MSTATAVLTLSMATYLGPSGATAAATYSFFSVGYQPPGSPRYIDFDTVKNQNGKFKYIYDNGPGFKTWKPFEIACEDAFNQITGDTGLQQYQHLLELWNHPGVLGLSAPDGTYTVNWANQDLEPQFKVKMKATEVRVTVQIEEAQ